MCTRTHTPTELLAFALIDCVCWGAEGLGKSTSMKEKERVSKRTADLGEMAKSKGTS